MSKFSNTTSARFAYEASIKLSSILLGGLLAVALLGGCSSIGKSLKSLMSGGDQADAKPKPNLVKYSDNDNVRFQNDRKYRRMTKSKFEDEAEVGSQAGSLWVMEGQGAYLFAQNKTRMMGDLLNVKVEGSPRNQLQSKVKVIAKLLERLDAPARGLASNQKGGAPAAGGAAPAGGEAKDAAADPAKKADGAGDTAAGEKVDAKNDPISTIQTVPTRIVEQLKDGSYRVRGMQPFMIGKREYKVIVTGVVRPEDYDEAGIDSSKLLDSQFDIVSSRKGATL